MRIGTTKKLTVKLGNKKATWKKLTFKSSKPNGLSVDGKES